MPSSTTPDSDSIGGVLVERRGRRTDISAESIALTCGHRKAAHGEVDHVTRPLAAQATGRRAVRSFSDGVPTRLARPERKATAPTLRFLAVPIVEHHSGESNVMLMAAAIGPSRLLKTANSPSSASRCAM